MGKKDIILLLGFGLIIVNIWVSKSVRQSLHSAFVGPSPGQGLHDFELGVAGYLGFKALSSLGGLAGAGLAAKGLSGGGGGGGKSSSETQAEKAAAGETSTLDQAASGNFGSSGVGGSIGEGPPPVEGG